MPYQARLPNSAAPCRIARRSGSSSRSPAKNASFSASSTEAAGALRYDCSTANVVDSGRSVGRGGAPSRIVSTSTRYSPSGRVATSIPHTVRNSRRSRISVSGAIFPVRTTLPFGSRTRIANANVFGAGAAPVRPVYAAQTVTESSRLFAITSGRANTCSPARKQNGPSAATPRALAIARAIVSGGTRSPFCRSTSATAARCASVSGRVSFSRVRRRPSSQVQWR